MDKTKTKLKEAPKQNELVEKKADDGIWQDERFQHLVSDPRFRSLPKAQRKVTIDKRFQGMFTDDSFKVKYTVDKYGRRVNQSNSEDLKKYYEMESSSASEADEAVAEEEERRKEEQAISRQTEDTVKGTASTVGDGDENDELVSDDEEVPKTLRDRLLDPQIDYSRGEGRLVTDSSSDDESTDEEDPELYIDHVWGELDVEADTTKESTRRLAVCNMDWDRIRASDLMVLFNSFLPPGGTVLSVKIYPSEFGKERMAEEEVHGPTELVGLGKDVKSKKATKEAEQTSEDGVSDSDEEELVQEQDSDAEEGDDYHMEKLRQYQLNRLRYYYAVVECDSIHTADKIYQECDGIEYESSATRVDLRFVPDDTTFDEDEPTDVCSDLPDVSNYKPRQFTTTALQQAKVDLTWDETAVERRELGDKLCSGKLDEVSDMDLRKIVAYSSEEEEEDYNEVDSDTTKATHNADPSSTNAVGKARQKKDDGIEKYKALLAEINEKEQKDKNKKYEMEYTWNVAESKVSGDKKDTDGDTIKATPQLTPVEKELQKRSEKNKKRKEERKKKKLQGRGIDPETVNSDSDSDSLPDGVDMNDPYFAEEFANGDFAESKATIKQKPKNPDKRLVEDEEDAQQAKELELMLDDEELADQGKQHFSLEQILKSEQETKSKRKRRQHLKKSKASIAEERKVPEDNFQVNVDDTRFKAVYSSHLFNIDPTDSHFKKTKGMEQLIQEKLKRRHGNKGLATIPTPEAEAKRPRKQLENALLVKSLKRKIQLKQQK